MLILEGDFASKLQNVLSDPEAMSKIMSVASSLGVTGGKSEETNDSEPTQIAREVSAVPNLPIPVSTDPRIALLNSLKPLLREDKRDRIDALTRAMMLASVMKNFKK